MVYMITSLVAMNVLLYYNYTPVLLSLNMNVHVCIGGDECSALLYTPILLFSQHDCACMHGGDACTVLPIIIIMIVPGPL